MNRLLTLGLLLILIACGQNSSKTKTPGLDTLTSNIEDKQQSVAQSNEPQKHETFNENIDTIPEVLKSFIPTNYSAINMSMGDANFDGLNDRILVLRKNTEETTSNYANDKPEKRPILLLLGQPDNSYKLAFRNDNAVYCIDCGGVFGDPFIGTKITNGLFSIEHGIAGGHHWEQEITFKFDKAKGNWILNQDHYTSYKFNDSEDENAEALVVDVDKLETVKDFGIILFDKFNIYNDSRK